METSIAGRAATAAVRIPRVGIGLGVIGWIVIAGAGALAARTTASPPSRTTR